MTEAYTNEGKSAYPGHKADILRAYLVDPENYFDTKWYYIREDVENKSKGWHRGADYELVVIDPSSLGIEQNARGACPCTTSIVKHHLIQHRITGRLVFIGSRCIDYFRKVLKINITRECPDCHRPNQCQTLRCSRCRVRCVGCGKYHRDNKDCVPPARESLWPPFDVSSYIERDYRERKERESRERKERIESLRVMLQNREENQLERDLDMPPTFNSRRYPGYTRREIYKHRSYMEFMSEQGWFKAGIEAKIYSKYKEIYDI